MAEPTSKIVTQCPHCGARFRAEARHLGIRVTCKNCKTAFEVAEAPAASMERAVAEPAARSTASSAKEPDREATWEMARETASAAAEASAVVTCVRHASVPAQHTCVSCGLPICGTCAFPQVDGSQKCPICATSATAAAPAVERPSAELIGTMCSRHPSVQALRKCKVCRTPMCSTCDFSFPGGVHVCPGCATSANKALSGRRKVLVGWAFFLAVWSTLGMVAMFSGVLAKLVDEHVNEQAMGTIISVLVFFPSLIGTGLGVGAFDRRLGNPPVIWIAAIWNILLMGIFLLLAIIGILMA